MPDTNPPSGAGGAAGTTGGSHTAGTTGATVPGQPATSGPSDAAGHETGPSGYAPPKGSGHSWDETHNGAAAGTAYHAFRSAWAVTMPKQRQSLQHLARRPLGG